MSCTGILSGQDASLQVGIETTWGTAVAAVVKLPFLSEALDLNLNLKKSEALVGRKAATSMAIMSKKPSGSIDTYATPDEAGYLFFLALGRELSPVTPSGGTNSRRHYFAPIASGIGKCLPKATIELDRVTGKAKMVSMKVNSLSISAAPEDYVKLSIDWIGYDEEEITTMTTGLVLSKKAFFKFIHGELIMDNLDDTYVISGTMTGVDTETVADVETARTGAAGDATEIYALGKDLYGKYVVYKYTGSTITRSTTTLTFADAPAGADQIASIHSSSGVLDTANWEIYSKVYSSIEDFTVTFNNNLRDNRFVMNGDDRQAEINPQQRDVSISFSAEYSSVMDKVRKYRFKTGQTLDIVLDFELAEEIESGFPYAMRMELPSVYLTSVKNPVSGPDAIMFSADGEGVYPNTAIGAGVDGTDGDTCTFETADITFVAGMCVEVADPDGDVHVFRYLGSDCSIAGTTADFATTPTYTDDLPEIFTSGSLLDDTNWEMLDVMVVRLTDARTTKWSA